MKLKIIEEIIEKYKSKLNQNDIAFIKRIYSTSFEDYADRIKAIGFKDKESVLDAGCGFGQWSIELAKLNKTVSSVDIKKQRVDILKEIARSLELHNIVAKQSGLDGLPFENDCFDAIFCYGVIFCTDWKKTLKEFYRVLKKGGYIYVNANGLGWYLNMWIDRPNATSDYDPRYYAALSFMNTIKYEKDGKPPEAGHIIIDKDKMIMNIEQQGLRIVAEGGEGTIALDNNLIVKSFFKAEYFGQMGIYEILVKKQG